MGELALRDTARSLVLYMKLGMSLHEAGLEALAIWPVGRRAGRYEHGRHDAAGRVRRLQLYRAKYLYMNEEMEEPALAGACAWRKAPRSDSGGADAVNGLAGALAGRNEMRQAPFVLRLPAVTKPAPARMAGRAHNG